MLYTPLLKSRSGGCPQIRSTFQGDLLVRRGPKPKHGPNMVRFGSDDLWTSALGVKRVQRSDPPTTKSFKQNQERVSPPQEIQTTKTGLSW